MRFVFKLMFWGFVALMILPSVSPVEPTVGSSSQIAHSANIDTGDALALAIGVANDMRGMCARQPELCEIGQRVVTGAVERAKQGAIVVGTMVEEHRTKQAENVETNTSSTR